MEPESLQHAQQGSLELSPHKERWQEPRLTFVEPTLTRHEQLEEVTGQFFGEFSP